MKRLCLPLLLAILTGLVLARPAYAQTATDTPTPTPTATADPYTVKNNLVACWELNEGSGTRYDAYGDNDLTDTNTVGSTSGLMGDAALYQVNQEYLSHVDNADLSMGDIDFTLLTWVQLQDVSVATDAVFLSKWYTGGNNREYRLEWYSITERFRFFVSSAGTTTNATVVNNSLGAPQLDTWYMIAAWHNAATNNIYISTNNGSSDSASVTGGVYNGAANFQIGTYQNGYTDWGGLVDVSGIWKRVLGDNERAYLYNSGAGRDCDYIINPPTVTPTPIPTATPTITPTPADHREITLSSGNWATLDYKVTAGDVAIVFVIGLGLIFLILFGLVRVVRLWLR